MPQSPLPLRLDVIPGGPDSCRAFAAVGGHDTAAVFPVGGVDTDLSVDIIFATNITERALQIGIGNFSGPGADGTQRRVSVAGGSNGLAAFVVGGALFPYRVSLSAGITECGALVTNCATTPSLANEPT